MINHVRTLCFNTTAVHPPGAFGFFVPPLFRPARREGLLLRLHDALYGADANRSMRSLRLLQLMRLAHAARDAGRLLADDPRITYDPRSTALLPSAHGPRLVAVGRLAIAAVAGPPRASGPLTQAWSYVLAASPRRLQLTTPDATRTVTLTPDSAGWVTIPNGPRICLDPETETASGTLWSMDRPAGDPAESFRRAATLPGGDLDALYDGFPADRALACDPAGDPADRALALVLAAARVARAAGARDEGDHSRG